jgi:transketolase
MDSEVYDQFLLDSGLELKYWSNSRFAEALRNGSPLNVLASACRLNTLSSIKAAGSGHIGTSFSSIEILLAIRSYLSPSGKLEQNSKPNGVFFSSKGHDAPAIYAVMHMLGEISDSQLFTLRRLNGLPGHPEIDTLGIPTNTGSLGMGISKAKGFIHANRLDGKTEKVIVLLGDGELQEGQIWEALPTAARDAMGELIVIVDGNKIQSDTWVEATSPQGDLKMRVEGAGWNFESCDGHDISALLVSMKKSGRNRKPTFIHASTIKGCGVTYMTKMDENAKFYKFHSGSVPDDMYNDACDELIERILGNLGCKQEIGNFPSEKVDGSGKLRTELDSFRPKDRPNSFVLKWAEFLSQAMSQNEDIVILDADLSFDTGTYIAREKYPSRYIQAGIAEQDMVSMAGTLALSNKIPFVHSFATFLTMRPTEQIFNNATERTRITYLGFLAGLLPSPPGFSHQAVSDVGIMSAIPGMQIIEPACDFELQVAFDHIFKHSGPTYLRMVSIGEFPNPINGREIVSGDVVTRLSGSDVAIICSGPWLTSESLRAAQMFPEGKCAVFTYPFLNSPPSQDTILELSTFNSILVLENYNPGSGILKQINSAKEIRSRVESISVEGIPQNGWNEEVLRHHNLDAESIAKFISKL